MREKGCGNWVAGEVGRSWKDLGEGETINRIYCNLFSVKTVSSHT